MNDPAQIEQTRNSGYQQAPAMVLSALVAAALDGQVTDTDLRQMVKSIGPALEAYRRAGLTLRDIILSAHADEESPDHALARRVVAASNACRGFDPHAIAAGALQRHMELAEHLRDYAQAIQHEELDGSEPELAQLIAEMADGERALRAGTRAQ